VIWVYVLYILLFSHRYVELIQQKVIGTVSVLFWTEDMDYGVCFLCSK